jgi:hypothetical protein
MQRFRIEILLFLTCLFAFAYFHQGGGWAQNARFAMVRAIVEEGRLSIDSYLIYLGEETVGRDVELVRVPVRDGEFSWHDKSYELAWADQSPTGFVPVNGRHNADREIVLVTGIAVSGDVSFHRSHFYPAKAPGTSLIAVPAYFLICHIEQSVGLNPDHWRILTCNAWLTSVLSVGLICAIGCVLFFRATIHLSDGNAQASALMTLAFAFGTMFFSYSTMLQEHSLVATELLASFYLIWRVKTLLRDSLATKERQLMSTACLSGFCLGLGCITNYMVGIVAVAFLVYLVSQIRDKRAWLAFGIGMFGPIAWIAAYHIACFGTPFTTTYGSEMNPVFRSTHGFMGLFIRPQGDALLALLFSPFRGLFFSSPILLLGVLGLWRMLRTPQVRAEACLLISVVVGFLAFNVCYIVWDSGWASGPRYLAPALPFLAAPAVFGFVRFFKTACALLAVSIALNLLFTAVDPQSPLGVNRFAMVHGRPLWTYNLLTEYELPLFLTGQARPILRAKVEEIVAGIDQQLAAERCPDDLRATRIAALRHKIQSDLQKEWSVSFAPFSPSSSYRTELALAGVTGPVSANPIGIYEGGYGFVFPLGSSQAKWNSFNLGEFLFPQMRLSLLPLLLVCGTLSTWILIIADRKDRSSSSC